MIKFAYNVLILFSIYLCSNLSFAQQHKINTTRTSTISIASDADFLGYDSYGFYYQIKNNVLSKIKDKKIYEYKNVSLGKITKVDFITPLKIMVFYENFNTVVTLDNQLNETQLINFSENEEPLLVTATGIASQNRLWVYNSLSQKMGLYDYLKNNYKAITPSFQGNIKYYSSDFNTFQWIDDNLNWYSCDVFGKITSLGKIPDFDQIQFLTDNSFIYTKDTNFYYFNLIKGESQLIDLDKKTFVNFYYKDQILSIFTNQEITNYKITIP